MNSNNSKYDNIISKSVLKSSGPPAVYQIRLEKGSGSLTRLAVGERNAKQINKTILLVGETGSGKSALINALFNYTMRVTWEDEIWFQIVEEEKKKSLSESQTSDVIVYEIFDFEDEPLSYSLTVIDTPGYGNTSGIEHDVIVRQRLFDLFRSEDGVHEVHAVGLVMKATDNRLSDRLKYVFDSVMSLFGKGMEKNIVALMTHSDGRRPKNALEALKDTNFKCEKNENIQNNYFLFNNCQHEDRTEEEQFLQHAFEISLKGLGKFTDFLEKTAPQKLEKTVEVLNERVRLAACIQNMKERIKLTELKQAEIRQIQDVLKKHEGAKNELIVEVDEVYKSKESTHDRIMLFNKSVCCTNCMENCHSPCTLAWNVKYCEVMKDSHCTVCTNKCPASAHVKENWMYITKTRRVPLSEVKRKQYEQSKYLEGEIQKLTAEKSQLLDESYQHVVSLEKIALKADSVSTFVHLDFLIDKMKEKGDKEKIQKLEEIRSRMDGETRAANQYMWVKLTEAEKGAKNQLEEQNSSDTSAGKTSEKGAIDQLK